MGSLEGWFVTRFKLSCGWIYLWKIWNDQCKEDTDLSNVATHSCFILFLNLRGTLIHLFRTCTSYRYKDLLSQLIRQSHCGMNIWCIIQCIIQVSVYTRHKIWREEREVRERSKLGSSPGLLLLLRFLSVNPSVNEGISMKMYYVRESWTLHRTAFLLTLLLKASCQVFY